MLAFSGVLPASAVAPPTASYWNPRQHIELFLHLLERDKMLHSHSPVLSMCLFFYAGNAVKGRKSQLSSVSLPEACQPHQLPLQLPLRRYLDSEAGSDPRGHLGVTWGVYLCAGKPPLADIILSHPPDLTRCDSVIGLAIPAMSGHIQYRGAASGDLYIGISGINRVLLS